MTLLDLARRAAGRSPAYLAKRAVVEVRRRAGARRLRARLATLDSRAVAAALGAPSLDAFWRRRTAAGFLYSARDLTDLRALHATRLAAESALLTESAERILRHEIDLLGSGPCSLGPEIDWHADFKSGRRWPLRPAHAIDYAELGQPSDVKVPWELSRAQHLPTLARAWTIGGDARMAGEARAQIDSWRAANPVGLGVNWACTMDVALRAVSWIWTLAILGAEPDAADEPLPRDFLERVLVALWAHALWIPAHLEVGEVNGNHFLSDALGMVACGSLFAGSREGDAWLDEGLRLLEREIRTQVGDDGVDVEASVPYHRLVLEIFLVAMRLAGAAGRDVSPGYRERLRAMLAFVDAYVTPGGSTPVVGDADDGRALVLGATDLRDHRYLLSTGAVLFDDPAWARRARRLHEDSLWLLGPSAVGPFDAAAARSPDSAVVGDPGTGERGTRGSGAGVGEVRAFRDSGFHVLRTAEQYLFVDAGPVGFHGRGGHGHNDCLSFEWHACGRPLLTDSGAYVYTASVEWRNRFRSTAFHNAIRVDGEEINRFPSALALWSLCDDARPIDVASGCDERGPWLAGGHTGYRRLADPVTVRRRFLLDARRTALRIEDRVEGATRHRIEVFFHAAPGAVAGDRRDAELELAWPDGVRARIRLAAGPELDFDLREGWFSPSYGVKVARSVWVASGAVAAPADLVWEIEAWSA